ncbi:MAG: 2-C-methyl-D-erythritol 4-phosphate cytidylyltransferase [Bacteroidales bacterium]|nr:2-C-methyl-D-erythritol 4-phosphate cytidylyltransferase [Bacteroidales bacterium]
MERKKYLVVMAGGSGTRMGAALPKQFLRIGDKCILHLTIEKFLHACPDINVITVLPSSGMQWWKDYCYENNFLCRQTLVAGGMTRFHSVRNGLAKVPDGALVAIHDAVRPLLSRDLIINIFDHAEKSGSAVPFVPVVDTIKARGGQSVDRSELMAIQTPQVFWSENLKKAYEQPYDTSYTDDASVLEADGGVVDFVEGEKFNIKLTTPDDLRLAEAILTL